MGLLSSIGLAHVIVDGVRYSLLLRGVLRGGSMVLKKHKHPNPMQIQITFKASPSQKDKPSHPVNFDYYRKYGHRNR